MKTKIAIDLPTRATLLAGLTPREAHEPLVRAEEAAAKAESAVGHARRELAAQERIVSEMPARVQRGEVKAAALTNALRERDAAALMVAPAESTLARARERVTAEESSGRLAVDREFRRRIEQLERAAAEVAPVLAEIGELADALAATRGPGVVLASVVYPCSPNCGANMRTMIAGGVK